MEFLSRLIRKDCGILFVYFLCLEVYEFHT